MKLKQLYQKYERYQKYEWYQKYEREILLVIITLFFLIPYFTINHFTIYKNNNQLDTILDELLPFLSGFILIYLTSYILVFIPYFFVKEKKYFRRIILAYFITLSISYIIFLIYPVKIIRPEITSESFFSQLTKLFYELDYPYNNFPSLHVTLSFLSAGVCTKYNQKYWWLFLWAGAIALSTLLVKQHYVLDVL